MQSGIYIISLVIQMGRGLIFGIYLGFLQSTYKFYGWFPPEPAKKSMNSFEKEGINNSEVV